MSLEEDGYAQLKYPNPINRARLNEAKTEVERDERDNAKARKIQEQIEGTKKERKDKYNKKRNETRCKGREEKITYQWLGGRRSKVPAQQGACSR